MNTKKVICLLLLLFFLVGCPSVHVPSGPEREPSPGTRTPRGTPYSVEASYQKGLQQLNNRNLLAAIESFNQTLEQDPNYVKAYEGLGEVYLLQGKYQLAEQNYLKALELGSLSLSTLLSLGSVQARQGKYEEALNTYQKALEISPQNAVVLDRLTSLQTVVSDAHLQKGLELKRREELDAALKELQAAQKLAPRQLGLLVEIGYIFLEKNEYDEADKYFQEVLTRQPDFISALLGAGEVQLAKGNPENARSYFEKVLNLEPDNIQARTFMEKLQGLGVELKPAPTPAIPQEYPREYLDIARHETLTRGELAVLIFFGLDLENKIQTLPDLASAYQVQFISDISGHWAKSYIVKITAYGLMEVFPDHTFQPDDVVIRGELAAIIDRIFTAFSKPLIIDPTRASSISFRDVSPENIYYRAVMATYLAGILDNVSDSEFGLSKPVSGSEAMEIMARVKERL